MGQNSFVARPCQIGDSTSCHMCPSRTSTYARLFLGMFLHHSAGAAVSFWASRRISVKLLCHHIGMYHATRNCIQLMLILAGKLGAFSRCHKQRQFGACLLLCTTSIMPAQILPNYMRGPGKAHTMKQTSQIPGLGNWSCNSGDWAPGS